MKETIDILKYVFRFPAITFWLTCIITPTSIISSFILYIIQSRRNSSIPSISDLVSSNDTKKAMRFGFIAGLVCIIVTQKTSHKYYQKLFNRNTNNMKLRQMMSVFVTVVNITMVCIDLSILGITFIDFEKHQILHIISTIIFLTSSLIFHYGIDELSGTLKRNIPVAGFFNLTILILSIACGFLFAFSKVSQSLYSIASICEITAFIFIYFKYIFVAMTVLGGNFLPRRIFYVETSEQPAEASYQTKAEYNP
ncbi:hypothetical protein TRFO_04434 [Tritrichomonas foetus]|uniref:CWH43-like N-terminal domain-containing protein n=1 Tax=Tritrichomonas foetus TaxID=1144522 RepID=A0A1J4KEM3_9EUKA|nr:hypothetical protein TRFO_04434 [Tritrichomonas foetus]|eukprot:OHT09889.1 hypothetical protein TRFO_04434 [Tritrichomonas foetus]